MSDQSDQIAAWKYCSWLYHFDTTRVIECTMQRQA